MSRSEETREQRIGRRVLAAREAQGLSQDDVVQQISAELGRDKTYTVMKISNLENGKRKAVGEHELSALSTVLHKPLSYFTAEDETADYLAADQFDSRTIRVVPLLWLPDVDFTRLDAAIEAAREAKNVYRIISADPVGDFAFRLVDDSMSPIFEKQRTTLTIQRGVEIKDLQPGDAVAVVIDARPYVRRIRYENSTVILEPANPAHRKFAIPLAEFEEANPLVGVVVTAQTVF